jgi:hypothetical protein
MKKLYRGMLVAGRKLVGRAMQVAAAGTVVATTVANASAQTDLTGTVSGVGTLWTAAEAIGISVIVFVVGRKIVKKI